MDMHNLNVRRAPRAASRQNMAEEKSLYILFLLLLWCLSALPLAPLCQDNVVSRARSMHGLGKGGTRRMQCLDCQKLEL